MKMISLIGRILCSAVKNLFNNQLNIFDFTSPTGQTEWNLTHHLANEIRKYIFWLDHDLDVTKRNLDNKRPDIIFHKRGINALNFLVVEMKYKNRSVEEDIRKIKEDWMGNELKYRFGTSIRIVDKNEYEVIIFDNNGNELESNQETEYLSIPNSSSMQSKNIIKLVNKIFLLSKPKDYLKNPQKQAKVKEYQRQIDRLVYKLYGLTDEEINIVKKSGLI